MDRLGTIGYWPLATGQLDVFVEQLPVGPQPLTGVLVGGAGVCDEAPEVARVIEAAQVHQLVYEYIIAHLVGHQNQAPVQADVARRRT